MATPTTGERSSSQHQRALSLPTNSSVKYQARKPRDMTGTHESRSKRSSKHHRRTSRVQPDTIDKLDNIGGFSYHHDGPFDAACRQRHISPKRSPIDALKTSNEEALKATPPDRVLDSIRRHKPLDWVAYYPPGTTDRDGRTYDYEEGWNMMTEDRGNFQRRPGVKLHSDAFQINPSFPEMPEVKQKINPSFPESPEVKQKRSSWSPRSSWGGRKSAWLGQKD